jgi:hypothetical protein
MRAPGSLPVARLVGTISRSAARLDTVRPVHRHDVATQLCPDDAELHTVAVATRENQQWATAPS